jgi:Protein of unknown function (DUF4236)
VTFRYRKRLKLGPLVLNFTERGLSSYSVKLGPVTWNPKRRRVTTDLPGGAYHTRRYGERK